MGMLLVTLVVMLLVVGAMSVGVIFGRKPITGSCGGVGQALNEKDYVCDWCGNDEDKCKEIQADAGRAPGIALKRGLGYDVGDATSSTDKGASH